MFMLFVNSNSVNSVFVTLLYDNVLYVILRINKGIFSKKIIMEHTRVYWTCCQTSISNLQ